MSLTLRSEKGSNLTSAEFDENITTLRDMIQNVIDNPVPGVGISNITQSGSTLTFHLTNGSTKGPFTMPSPNFRYRGDWAATTAYLKGDFFKEALGLYTVVVAHTSASTFDPDATSGGDPVYVLAIPFLVPPPTWIDIESDAGDLFIDLSLGDKFRVHITENTTIAFPESIPSYTPPFILDIIMDGAFTVSFGPEYIGDDPPLLTGTGDRNIVSGVVLDETTAILSTVKQIPA